jgi:hypothetical protein
MNDLRGKTGTSYWNWEETRDAFVLRPLVESNKSWLCGECLGDRGNVLVLCPENPDGRGWSRLGLFDLLGLGVKAEEVAKTP